MKNIIPIVLLSVVSTIVQAQDCLPLATKAYVQIGKQLKQSIDAKDIEAVKRHFDAFDTHKDIKDCQAIQKDVVGIKKERQRIITNLQTTEPSNKLADDYKKAKTVYSNIQQALQNQSTEKIDTNLEAFNLHEPSSHCYYEAEKQIRKGREKQTTVTVLEGKKITLGDVLSDCDELLQTKTTLIVPIYQHNEAIRKGARKTELANWQKKYIHGEAQQEVFAKEKSYIPKVKEMSKQIIWQYKSSTTSRSSDKNYIADTDIGITTETETRTTQCTDYTFSSDGKELINRNVYGCAW